MDILFAPWRSQYIETFKDDEFKDKEPCFFCHAIKDIENEEKLLVVARAKHCIAMLNKFPYNNGHVLIAPLRHVASIDDLSDDEYIDVMFMVKRMKKCLDEIYHPHAFNIGINLGRAAGAGVPGHMHFHIVPRWDGDSSFMTAFADVKVVSESLDYTQKALSETYKKLFPEL